MATVTIRGSIMPSAHLARGEIKTVQLTPHVENLIRQGFVDVIERHDTPAGKVVSPEPPAETPTASPETPVPAATPTTTPYTLESPPAKTADREDWAEFLASFPETGIVTEGKDLAELIGEWEIYQDEHVAPKA